MVGTYRHALRRVVYKCATHGRFSALPSNVESGHGCAKCAWDRQRTKHDDHVAMVRRIHGDRLRVVGAYCGSHKKLEYLCPTHGSFFAKPANVVHRSAGCRQCYQARPRRRKTHETYAAEAFALGVVVLDRYETALTSIRHRCSKGHVWQTSPNQLLSGYGCPLCDRSQYRRRPIRVGTRTVMVQGSEGRAVEIMLSEGIAPNDLAFTAVEGRPTFRYAFAGRTNRTYVPDAFVKSRGQVVEVKSAVTLGIYDRTIFAQVCAKARAVIAQGVSFRLLVIHRGQALDVGADWYEQSWRTVVARFRRQARAQDRRTKDRRTGRK